MEKEPTFFDKFQDLVSVVDFHWWIIGFVVLHFLLMRLTEFKKPSGKGSHPGSAADISNSMHSGGEFF